MLWGICLYGGMYHFRVGCNTFWGHVCFRGFGSERTVLVVRFVRFSLQLLQLGEDHDRTKESSECLKHLTQQAVKFQKTMNQLSKGEKVNMMSPIQVGGRGQV